LPLQINPGAADEAGILVAFGGMADEVGGFVNDEQVGVLVDDVEQFFQVQKLNHGRTRLDTDFHFDCQRGFLTYAIEILKMRRNPIIK